MTINILIIEDEQLIRWSLRQKMEGRKYHVTEAETGERGLAALEDASIDLVMLDYKLPDMTGLEVLKKIRKNNSDVIVIMMTAFSTIESAVDAIKLGAYDYITKPFNMEQLLHTIDKALETTKLRREIRELRRNMQDTFNVDRIIGQSPPMLKLYEVLNRISQSGASTVFLRGESGTGKDLLARIIHYNSDRVGQAFMNITCTALSETLLESELFGHEKGAFTDAKGTKKGLFEVADGGTIFLDEVGDMPMALQAKLLRFLEERAFRRVGGTQEISVDVRIIAATNREVEDLIEKGKFRSDLLYRLDVIPITLPPLRERGDDVRLLAQHFVHNFAREFKKPISGIDEAAYDELAAYSWPGNVRELRNVTERAVLLSGGTTIVADDIMLGRGGRAVPQSDPLQLPENGIDLRELENAFIKQALQRAGNNKTQAAKLLHLSRDAFRYRLERLDLD